MPLEKASPKNNYHYSKQLKNFANHNRKTLTKSAAAMWKYLLSAKKMKGYTFRRERPILNYIADFACLPLLLVIEVDGITHSRVGAAERDAKKDQDLNEVGFTVLRFTSAAVLRDLELVKDEIENWIEQREKVLGLKPRTEKE